MSYRIPLFQVIRTPEGDRMDAYTAMYEAVGVDVHDDYRNARPASARPTRQLPHEYGDCAKGPSRCPVHKREYRQALEQRKQEQRNAERERANRQAAMNTFRIEQIRGAKVRKAVDA